MANEESYTVKEMLTRLEEKVDKVISDHESRLRKLENLSARAIGALMIASSGVSALVAYIVAH